MEIFHLTMSLQGFKFFLRHIRFDNKTTREERQKIDRLAPIREVFDAFNSNLCKYFCLSDYTTVVEMLAAFRGKCGFRVYMPNKPNRYGIKMYSLVDPKMFYTAKLEIYVGQQPPGPFKVQTDNSAYYRESWISQLLKDKQKITNKMRKSVYDGLLVI